MPEPNFKKISAEDYISLNGVGLNQLKHPFFEAWFQYFISEYRLPTNKSTIIFIPCAAIKPYHNSPIHKMFNAVIDKYRWVQKIVISNAGVIPYEYSDRFPFTSYDWNPLSETDIIRAQYREITYDRITNFIKSIGNRDNLKFLSYLRLESDSQFALVKSFNEMNIPLLNIKINGQINSTKDTDLVLILPENLESLNTKLKSLEGNN